MIRDFDFCVNTEFIFGREAHRRAGDKLKQLGIKRLLIHHDGGPYLYDTGLLKDIKEDMERCGIQVWELSGVKPNPRLDLVYQGIRLVRQTARYLVSHRRPWLVPGLIVKSGFKYAGYRLGRCYRFLPVKLAAACSMNKEYWK